MKRVMNVSIMLFTFFLFALVVGNKNINAIDEVSWGYSATNMDDVLNKVKDKPNKEEIVIAVLDSGIDADHEWFENNRIHNFASTCSADGYFLLSVFPFSIDIRLFIG